MLTACPLALAAMITAAPAPDARPEPCGAVPWLAAAPRPTDLAPAIAGGGDGPYRVVCRFHVVRRADGTGGIDEAMLPLMMNDLNVGFRDTPFRFVREPGVVYIDNDEFYADFPSVLDQIDLVNMGYEDGVVSWYVTPLLSGGAAPAGTWVGPPFTSGLRGIVMSYPATGSPASIVTPPHEMGHLFGLAHPYETVFGTECTSGSNCAFAGDRICDTPASPVVFSQNTTATGYYFEGEPGPCPNDPPYDPDPTLYMDAGWPAGHILRNRFTPEQIEEMIDFAFALNPDLFEQAPSFLVDCDNNGIDDMDEIVADPALDVNRDLVPDTCQVFPAPRDLLVSGMNPVQTNRVRFFDGDTGDYRGDVWNGMTWVHSLHRGPDGLIYLTRLTIVQRLNMRTGRTVDNFIDTVLENEFGVLVDLLFDDDGTILVLNNNDATIRRYDGETGAFIELFAALGSIGMSLPKAMAYGPDGHIYVVGTGGLGNTVQRVDRSSGTPLGTFAGPGSPLGAGAGIVFHNGRLYVSNAADNSVLCFNATSGAYVGVFVNPGSGGLSNPHDLRFGPDGNLYVASRNTNSVKRYNGTSGAPLGDFVVPGAGGSPGTGGLVQPAGLLFLPAAEDVNGDGAIDVDDLIALLLAWGPCPLQADAACTADVDGSGTVDVDDLIQMLLAWSG